MALLSPTLNVNDALTRPTNSLSSVSFPCAPAIAQHFVNINRITLDTHRTSAFSKAESRKGQENNRSCLYNEMKNRHIWIELDFYTVISHEINRRCMGRNDVRIYRVWNMPFVSYEKGRWLSLYIRLAIRSNSWRQLFSEDGSWAAAAETWRNIF